ncbi:MAG: hypothetical protein A2033_06675 [Bacteroidetes bacterium GWA2_31_9]|nr:MAG: hypothetical protein A2033_06675 [Bacteroidetes bacterium GWA2_31_9]
MYLENITLKADALNLTEEEFFNFCSQNKELKFEMDSNNQIYIMTPTGGITGNRNSEIIVQLGIWNKINKTGYVFDSSTGFNLPNGAMRSPDSAWIAKERWVGLSIEDRKRFPHICPDFIIELLSESDSLNTIKEKMNEWLQNGCRLAWLIDFENKTVYIYKPKSEVIQQSFEQALRGEDVLLGFELNLTEFLTT